MKQMRGNWNWHGKKARHFSVPSPNHYAWLPLKHVVHTPIHFTIPVSYLKSILFKVWYESLTHQHHLEVHLKCRISGSTSQNLNFKRSSGDLQAHPSLRGLVPHTPQRLLLTIQTTVTHHWPLYHVALFIFIIFMPVRNNFFYSWFLLLFVLCFFEIKASMGNRICFSCWGFFSNIYTISVWHILSAQ